MLVYQRVNIWFMTFKSPTICQGSWAVENPTGDARYWGPASWLRFLHGPHAAWLHQGGLQGPETVAASGAGSLNNLEAPFDTSFSGKRHQGSNHSLFQSISYVYCRHLLYCIFTYDTYGGFLKWGYPQIIHFNDISIINQPSIWGYPHFWKPPYKHTPKKPPRLRWWKVACDNSPGCSANPNGVISLDSWTFPLIRDDKYGWLIRIINLKHVWNHVFFSTSEAGTWSLLEHASLSLLRYSLGLDAFALAICTLEAE